MISIEKNKFYSLLLLVFILGIAAGYLASIVIYRSSKTIFVNSCFVSNGSNGGRQIEIKADKTDLTAKEAFQLITQEARIWSSDAYLHSIELASKKFNTDGSSNGWKIYFYSKEKNKLYEILAKDGESRGGTEKETKEKIQTLKGDFIDSTKIADYFYKTDLNGAEIIDLKMYYHSSSKKFVWTIFYSKGTRTVDAEI